MKFFKDPLFWIIVIISALVIYGVFEWRSRIESFKSQSFLEIIIVLGIACLLMFAVYIAHKILFLLGITKNNPSFEDIGDSLLFGLPAYGLPETKIFDYVKNKYWRSILTFLADMFFTIIILAILVAVLIASLFLARELF